MPLYWGEDHVELLKLMLQYKVDLRMGDGEHVMLRAVERNKEDILLALLAHDKSLVKIDYNRGSEITYGPFTGNYWTPLHVAAACDRVDMARILISNGADVSLRNRYWWNKDGSLVGGYETGVNPGFLANRAGGEEINRLFSH